MTCRFLILLIFLIQSLTGLCQGADVAPTGRQNYLAVEGGGMQVAIDTSTPLNTLLLELSKDWYFVGTGKRYWIGYTKDMFSIAARGDSAIELLLHLAENSENENAKIGAIYTLHLIGINRTIAGRLRENFVNPKARLALLQLLKINDLQETVMTLLQRDPWLSDIPSIMSIMQNSTGDCWALIKGLTRYEIINPPVHQPIPEFIQNISIKLKSSEPQSLSINFDFDAQIKEVLDSFRRSGNTFISIEDKLFKRNLAGSVIRKFDDSINIRDLFDVLGINSYINLGSRVQYYVVNDKLYICSSETAQALFVNWWKNQTAEQKAIYTKNSR
jgi:hypothetical protein